MAKQNNLNGCINLKRDPVTFEDIEFEESTSNSFKGEVGGGLARFEKPLKNKKIMVYIIECQEVAPSLEADGFTINPFNFKE